MRFSIILGLLALTPPLLASDQAAIALIEKVRAFVGGDAVDAAQAVRLTSKNQVSDSRGRSTSVEVMYVVEYPDSMRMELRHGLSTVTQIVTPTSGYIMNGKRRYNLTASERDVAFLPPALEPLTVLKMAKGRQYDLSASGVETIDGVAAATVDIRANSVLLRWWIDPETGRVLRSARTTEGRFGGTDITTFREWNTFNGLTLPTALSMARDRRTFATLATTSVEVTTAAPTALDTALTAKRSPSPAELPAAAERRPTPLRPANVCETTECSVLVRIMKGDGEPCAFCQVMFTWSGDDATRLTNERGFVEFRSPVRYVDTIATIVNRTGLILPLKFNVDTLGGTSITITTPYTGR